MSTNYNLIIQIIIKNGVTVLNFLKIWSSLPINNNKNGQNMNRDQ